MNFQPFQGAKRIGGVGFPACYAGLSSLTPSAYKTVGDGGKIVGWFNPQALAGS